MSASTRGPGLSPELTATVLAAPAEGTRAADQPLLIVGPSLGTSVTGLWAPILPYLREEYTIVGWDLPGHGRSRPAEEPFSIAELAAGVVGLEKTVSADLGVSHTAPRYAAGISIGGAVTLTLGRTAGSPFARLAALCTAARIGEPQMWQDRAELVENAGTPTMVEGSAQRWFAPGFLEKHPERATTLLHALQQADRHSYAHACRALADYDLRATLSEITVPVLAVAGEQDEVCTPADLQQIADAVPQGQYQAVAEAAHQAVTEQPEQTAQILKEFFRV